MASNDIPDVAIVGAGIGGSALAAALSMQGLRVALLERGLSYVDRVRGEFMAPWGVAELRRLGLLDTLTAAGGIFSARSIPYDENTPGDAALARQLDLSKVLPDVPGALCMGHPAMCVALSHTAALRGAEVWRGINDVRIEAGEPPRIAFQSNGRHMEWRPRLIVGADGRASTVRRQLGFKFHHDPPHNLLGGMLVEGVPDWPQDVQVIGTEGQVHFLVFPQGGTKLRLYLCYGLEDRAPYAGPDRQGNLLAAFRSLQCLPYHDAVGAATPIGPFNSFPNEDHWTDDPTAPGIVLIGDAAGHNDPIIGQGLSIALRDARIVSDIIRPGAFTRDAFQPYLEERAERMRRLRITARLAATLRAEFGQAARERRARVLRRATIEKHLSPGLAALIGPEKLPAEAFDSRTIDSLLAP